MIVPNRRSSQPQQMQPTPPPPNGVYVAMAAAQMDAEGRLFKQPDGGVGDKMNSVPESQQSPVRV
jgi:hypothetical protein